MTLQDALERWQQELDEISSSDNWRSQERRLVETQHTITSYRAHIFPLLTESHPYDVIVADEMTQLVNRLEELRTDLYSSASAHQEIGELLAALRALARVAARIDQSRLLPS
ncbi:hypothetical protein ACI2LF_12070 [Kribbella sp. NPDC020789]